MHLQIIAVISFNILYIKVVTCFLLPNLGTGDAHIGQIGGNIRPPVSHYFFHPPSPQTQENIHNAHSQSRNSSPQIISMMNTIYGPPSMKALLNSRVKNSVSKTGNSNTHLPNKNTATSNTHRKRNHKDNLKRQDDVAANAEDSQEVGTSEILRTTEKAVELTSVSPIEATFGGLTGLQGLPALSVIQSIKLLVALFPFLLPIVFCPLLIFTLGIFMIPIFRVHHFIDSGDGELNGLIGVKVARALSTAGKMKNIVVEKIGSIAKEVVQDNACSENIFCPLGKAFLSFVKNETNFTFPTKT